MTFTLTDLLIVVVVGFFAGRVIFQMIKHKDESVCERCAHAPKCSVK
ncbi:MAG: hypothetical protein K8Q99_07100 [Acholeplasmataceae bacterium]|nr:hypothetical protein [Acholeplasmataceae bacterium]